MYLQDATKARKLSKSTTRQLMATLNIFGAGVAHTVSKDPNFRRIAHQEKVLARAARINRSEVAHERGKVTDNGKIKRPEIMREKVDIAQARRNKALARNAVFDGSDAAYYSEAESSQRINLAGMSFGALRNEQTQEWARRISATFPAQREANRRRFARADAEAEDAHRDDLMDITPNAFRGLGRRAAANRFARYER